MTQFVVNDGAGPRLHAFVVGVSRYPYIAKGLGEAEARRLLGDLAPITVPRPSAVAVAEWLLHADQGTTEAPVGTLEVLISAEEAVTLDSAKIDTATFVNFREAFVRWRKHCSTDEANIALFYFCGHGWKPGEQLLLLEDLGEDPDRLLANSVDLAAMRAAMYTCGARTQVYFIDACREIPRDLLTLRSSPTPLMDASKLTGALPHVDAPVFFSTADGQSAFGDGGMATPYTDALIAALGGRAARRGLTGWTVTTGSLASDLQRIIEWNRPPGRPRQHVTIDGLASTGVLRSLTGPPKVPFRVACEPPAPASVTASPVPPTAAATDLEFEGAFGEIAVGVYVVSVSYPDGSKSDPVYRSIDPPNSEFSIMGEQL
ncbi:caspase family protein [Dactylosporangium sucinum]|uniref:Peptidase C14 caspase domain-containing protein n=1 Tax=Dactylosporangium sucinum TaxID=1424081 RepID=A0A917UE62_9ACTN|nr:caspase family protein [Dactylosporangium sucinum]GGM86452.1 hypothetical protein GCM10007977_105440 [Dactylosporangium sucinum]